MQDFDFDVKIPYCRNLNNNHDEEEEKKSKKEQPLTELQAAESRLVFKVRFIVETVNGDLKEHKALDYVRNSRLGYLFVDYRIISAIFNFSFIPIYTDKPKTIEVALKMIRKRFF